jgi:hypothetical protein
MARDLPLLVKWMSNVLLTLKKGFHIAGQRRLRALIRKRNLGNPDSDNNRRLYDYRQKTVRE